MSFQVSPGVNVTEVSLVTSTPQVASATGAIAGQFAWGPVGKTTLISNETQLVERYGRPTANNFETFFSGANFLSYSNRMYVSRAAKTTGVSTSIQSALLGNTTLIVYSSTANVAPGQSIFGTGVADGATVLTTNNSSISNTFNANSGVSTNGEIAISGHPFISGERVVYTTASGNTALAALANNGQYYIRNANTTVVYLASTVDGAVITLAKGATESGHTFTRANDTRITLTSNTTVGTASSPVLATLNYSDVTLSFNAFANTSSVLDRTQVVVKNSDHYETVTFPAGVEYVAKYPGDLGNSLKISVVDSVEQYSSTINPFSIVADGVTTNATVVPGSAGISVALNATTANVFVANSGSLAVGAAANVATAVKNKLIVGDYVEVGNSSINKQKLQIKSISNVTTTGNTAHFTVTFEDNYKLASAYSSNTFTRYWEYSTVVGKAPGTSKSLTDVGSTAVDQVSVVVVDEIGRASCRERV
jgi:hypothetical protein